MLSAACCMPASHAGNGCMFLPENRRLPPHGGTGQHQVRVAAMGKSLEARFQLLPKGVWPDELGGRTVLQFANSRGWVGRKASDRSSRELILGQTEPASLIVRRGLPHLQTLYLISLGLRQPHLPEQTIFVNRCDLQCILWRIISEEDLD